MNELQLQVNREVSEKIRDHLIKQHGVSVLDGRQGTCAYRGVAGKMCAVGCLIPDDKYKKEFEDTALTRHNPIWDILREEYGDYLLVEMLRRWQIYHDSHSGSQNYQRWLDKVPGATSPEKFHEYLMEDLQEWCA